MRLVLHLSPGPWTPLLPSVGSRAINVYIFPRNSLDFSNILYRFEMLLYGFSPADSLR